MIRKMIKKMWGVEGHEGITTPRNQKAEFLLLYKELEIGHLKLDKGVWQFAYSDEFKNQREILPLIDFPDTSKIYKEAQLWPFFSYRIPGLNQPMVKDIIQREKIDQKNEADLLKKFGHFSVFNPFILEPAY